MRKAERAEELVRETLRDKAGVQNVYNFPLDSNLQHDLRVDSLEMVESLVHIEDVLGVEISEKELFGVRTLKEFIAVVEAYIPEGEYLMDDENEGQPE